MLLFLSIAIISHLGLLPIHFCINLDIVCRYLLLLFLIVTPLGSLSRLHNFEHWLCLVWDFLLLLRLLLLLNYVSPFPLLHLVNSCFAIWRACGLEHGLDGYWKSVDSSWRGDLFQSLRRNQNASSSDIGRGPTECTSSSLLLLQVWYFEGAFLVQIS